MNALGLSRRQIYDLMQVRDPSLDGVVFVGVLTTNIYCRPTCRARIPKLENIKFYPSAEAAEKNGFRPCLRCRPETAPRSPAWKGTLATVERAVALIEGGALETSGVEELADRLGIGARHLTRLFSQHLNASPVQVARDVKLKRAAKLLFQTDKPVNEIAVEAGFGSERRMRAAFQSAYGLPPSKYRKKRP